MSQPIERITVLDVAEYKNKILDQSVLVTADDAARILACSPRTVYDLVSDGHLHAYTRTIGRRGLRILASELRDYVSSIKIDRERWRE